MTTAQDPSTHYIWFDTEFSSLNLDEARLMQVAAVITNARLERVLPAERDLKLIVKLPDGAKCSGWVNQHLQALVQRCRSDEGLTLSEVNRRVGAYIDEAVGAPAAEIGNRPLLAGNSLQCDLQLAARDLPDLIARTHYRVVDVSSWKMVWRNSLGRVPFDKSNQSDIVKYFPGEYNNADGAHDAHFDVLASIAELNYYLQHINDQKC